MLVLANRQAERTVRSGPNEPHPSITDERHTPSYLYEAIPSSGRADHRSSAGRNVCKLAHPHPDTAHYFPQHLSLLVANVRRRRSLAPQYAARASSHSATNVERRPEPRRDRMRRLLWPLVGHGPVGADLAH